MTFDPTKPVQTRDGRKARIICMDFKCPKSIVALISDNDGSEYISTFYPDGSGGITEVLINVPETKSSWFPVFYAGHFGRPYIAKNFVSELTGVKSIIELRMCDGKLVEAIQHEV